MTRPDPKSTGLAVAAMALCIALQLPPALASNGSASAQAQQAAVSDIVVADTNVDLPDGARFVAPQGWSMRAVEGGAVLTAPEQDSRIVIVNRSEPDPAAAVAAAWSAYQPARGQPAPGQERPPLEGWDRTIRYEYAPADPGQRRVMGLALSKGDGWTVLIYDVTHAVSERRDAQIEVIFNSLLPRGYQRESFAGRNANPLDQNRINSLVAMIESARRDYDIPGVALGLVQNGQVVFAGGFGVREAGGNAPVDADTLFNVASIGKAWTTLLLARQVAAGDYGWDSPVQAIWPEFAIGDHATSERVRVRHLVCACTGMPRDDYGWLFEGETYSARSIMSRLAATRPTSQFGDTYQYSNLMAAAGGYFGGHVRFPDMELGAAYDRAMQELVFNPLGMVSTTPDFTRALGDNHATGHASDVSGAVVPASQGLNLAAVSTRPSGNHWSNVTDILRYIQMELAGGRLPHGERYIDQSVLQMRAVPQVTEGLNEYYGMGLKIDRQWGVTVVHHGGTAAGYRSHMMWLPDHNVGAVILINSDSGSALRPAFRRRLLELLFDGAPVAEADLARFAVLDREAAQEERSLLTVPPDNTAVAALAAEYHSSDLGALRVYREGGSTWFDFGAWRSEIASFPGEDGKTSFVTVSPGLSGYVFEAAERDGRRMLLTREAQRGYEFVEVRQSGRSEHSKGNLLEAAARSGAGETR